MEYHRGISHDVGKGYLMRWENAHDIFFNSKNNGLLLVLTKWQIG